MSEITKPILLNETGESIRDLLEAQNHLISHQNAAIDLLASDKRAALVNSIEEVAELIYNDELLEVMDYGDQIALPWSSGGTEYVPEINFCHLETAELEDGEQVKVADFEWEYTIPFGMPFDAPEALFESESALAAGTYHFTIANDSWGGNNGKVIQFTVPETIPAGYQIRKSGAYNANITACTLDVYESADSLTKLYSMTPTEGSGGTDLGTTNGSSDLNHWHRVVLGYNRWSTSNMRQFLNAEQAAGSWWTKQNKWDVKPSQADTTDGFLHGYSDDVKKYFLKTKIQTACNTVMDGGVTDITYDKVFLSSLEQMYAVPQAAGIEGDYWEYYKRLLGRTTPSPTSQTYARLIKYALNSKTSAQDCWRRSAYRGYANLVWSVSASGNLNSRHSGNAISCAPCLRIGK